MPQCIYCGSKGNTRDHVPPKSLLEKPYPKNLNTVPSCPTCNSGFSLDEQYFLTVLAHIGTAYTLQAKLERGGVVDRSLSRSPAFDERIINSLKPLDDGRILLQPEHDRIKRVIQKVAYGLFFLRYRRISTPEKFSPVGAYPYNIEETRPASVFIATFTERFKAKRWIHIQRGIFSYIIVRDRMMSNRLCCIIDFHQTLWGSAYIPYSRERSDATPPQLLLF